jgi:hypothetical protein
MTGSDVTLAGSGACHYHVDQQAFNAFRDDPSVGLTTTASGRDYPRDQLFTAFLTG